MAIKKRNKIWKRCRCTKSDADYERYKASRNQVIKELRKATKVFGEKLSHDVKDNPKSFLGTCALERSQRIRLAH